MSSFSLNKWWHLVGKEIKQISDHHTLEGQPNKTIFRDYLIKDLGVKEESVVDISQKSNMFRIQYKDIYYNIFIEHTDGGGADQRITPSRYNKRVCIPSINAFWKLINNYERALVINIYCPLNEDLTPNWENRVYCIIKPNVIQDYKFKENKRKKKGNPSSRWVNLLGIQEIIKEKDKNYNLNRKENIYLVNWEKLTEFFNETLAYQYISMFNQKHEEFAIKVLDKTEEKLEDKVVSAERRLFRALLITNGRGIKCEIINCRINLEKILIASHIRPVNLIKKDTKLSREEKLKQISDCNNGFLFCRNHDALFDKFLITFKEGKIVASSDVEKVIDTFNLNLDNVVLEIKNQETINYLQYHQKLFAERNDMKFL